ncbi:hypothetical protein N7481_011477 [Penicillium waksmanii]|uniref:uncharacterized protein n=1 Tax=Penicillium waksmanii TaxID=69791 RepID=UPI0025494B94|nr:uncharacterized protein N7481_011477 [Penicillium waksmanii]KAJ5974267.1 hypothetical protein N7481_011477 [Penicillium waksmanii]
MYSQDKQHYSRTVSRIAAGEYDAYQEPLSAESLGCLLSDHVQQNLAQERIREMHTFQRVMEREKHYFEFRHKKVRRFKCDNPEDSDTEYALFPTNNNEVWGSGVNSDISINTPPYGIPYDSEQPFGSPDRPDERMTSTPVTPVQAHKYPHPVHKAVSSMSGDLGLGLSLHKEDTSEATSIAEQIPTVEISPPTPPVDAAIPKKKKKKAKRKLRHTGKKAKARAVAAAATAADHVMSSEKSDDNEDTVVQAENISASSDIANRIEAELPEKPVTFTPSSSSVSDKDSLNYRPPSSEIDFLTAAKHDLAQHAMGITLAINREGNGNRTSQAMDRFDTSAAVEIPEEAWELHEACFADDEQSPEDIAPMWDGYQSLVEERQTQVEPVYFTQWDSPYPNIVCHTYSICAWQPACRFHQRKVGCGCWHCPLPQRSCCCAHAPVDCYYHSLVPEENPNYPEREYKHDGSVWRGPFTYREYHTSVTFTTQREVSIPSSPHHSSLSFFFPSSPSPPSHFFR